MPIVRAFLAVLIVGIAAPLHVPAGSVGSQQVAQTTKTAATDFRTLVASDMQQAAKRVGLHVDESHVLVTTRADAFVSVAPADGQKDVFMFMHASFSDASCAKVFAEGDYSVRMVPVKQGNPTHTQYINAEGKVVATGTLMAETRHAQPEEKDKLQVGMQLRHTGGATARTVFGICKCQYIFPFSWRRLHSVVV